MENSLTALGKTGRMLTHLYMFNCRTKLCQLLCLKYRGKIALEMSFTLEPKNLSPDLSNRPFNTHFENSVGLGHIKVAPLLDQCSRPVRLISSSSNIEYSLPTNAA